MWILLIFWVSLSYQALVEYKLWKNYGEIFYDSSGSNNHGVNGQIGVGTIKNTYYTDRGAYFNKQSVIFIPALKVYPSPNTVIIWMNANTDNGRIYSRWDPEFCLLVEKADGKILNIVDDLSILTINSSEASWKNSNIQLEPFLNTV